MCISMLLPSSILSQHNTRGCAADGVHIIKMLAGKEAGIF